MAPAKLLNPVTIDRPMVLIPVDDYRALLAEAAYLPPPRLARQIAAARARFRKGRVIPWEQLRRALHK